MKLGAANSFYECCARTHSCRSLDCVYLSIYANYNLKFVNGTMMRSQWNVQIPLQQNSNMLQQNLPVSLV